MSIALCSNCKVTYWRFRGDHPPSGFCSVLCHAIKKKKSQAPPSPQAVLNVMMRHRLTEHHSTSVLEWFDCTECDQLEKSYSESLEWHTEKITRDIAVEARTR